MGLSTNKIYLASVVLVLSLDACKEPTINIGRSLDNEEGEKQSPGNPGLIDPPPGDPLPGDPLPGNPEGSETALTSQAHLAVIKQYCISCHSGYHNAWKNYDTNEEWINSGLVVKDNASASLLVLFSKYNGINSSGTMPKVNNGWTAAEAKVLIDWINAMSKAPVAVAPSPVPSPVSSQNPVVNPAPSPSPSPSIVVEVESPVVIAPGDYYRGSSDSLPMLGATSVASILNTIFGPDGETIVMENITKRRAYFGGSCDVRNDYLLCNSKNADNYSYTLTHRYGSTSGREGYRAKACKSLHFNDPTLNYALDQVEPSATRLNPPTDAQIVKLYQLFYPGVGVPDTVLGRLRDIKNTAASLSVKDSWRYVLLTVCFSADWQIN